MRDALLRMTAHWRDIKIWAHQYWSRKRPLRREHLCVGWRLSEHPGFPFGFEMAVITPIFIKVKCGRCANPMNFPYTLPQDMTVKLQDSTVLASGRVVIAVTTRRI
jgi:hypothetical protein